MECYVNDKGKLYIGVSASNDDLSNAYITLKKNDINELIYMIIPGI